MNRCIALGLAVALSGCVPEPKVVFPLQSEATAFFNAKGGEIDILADTLEADDDIQSLDCSELAGVLLPQSGISRKDGSDIDLPAEKVDKYKPLVAEAGVCDGGAVRGGVIFDLFEISAPTFEQSIQLIRVVRDGDEICSAELKLADSDWCVYPLDDDWSLLYSWRINW